MKKNCINIVCFYSAMISASITMNLIITLPAFGAFMRYKLMNTTGMNATDLHIMTTPNNPADQNPRNCDIRPIQDIYWRDPVNGNGFVVPDELEMGSNFTFDPINTRNGLMGSLYIDLPMGCTFTANWTFGPDMDPKPIEPLPKPKPVARGTKNPFTREKLVQVQPFQTPNNSPDLSPSDLSMIQQELNNLLTGVSGEYFVTQPIESDPFFTYFLDLTNFPSLSESSTLNSLGFTEYHLVYRNDPNSYSGVDLGVVQAENVNLLEFESTFFDSLDGFSENRFSLSIVNPNTLDHVLVADCESVPEPTSTLSLLSLGILGAGATLKRKLKPSNSIKKETTKVG